MSDCNVALNQMISFDIYKVIKVFNRNTKTTIKNINNIDNKNNPFQSYLLEMIKCADKFQNIVRKAYLINSKKQTQFLMYL